MSIWWFAFGYFACYVPYSALTKALSDGLVPGLAKIPGLSLLPIANVASMIGMVAFISGMGWWKHAGRARLGSFSFPWPNWWTFASGMGTATVIVTTTLAYTFSGVSIVFMMLLMRGGVLIMAPLVDALAGRHVRWFSMVALLLSLASLVVAFVWSPKADFALTYIAMIDVALYLGAYFVRLRFMSRLAKSSDPDASKRYFVEEQMVATPAVVLALVGLALVGPDRLAGPLRFGFTSLPPTALLLTIAVGLLSQGTGVFGGLVLLDKRENSFCVPVNRASSMLAGLAATLLIAAVWGGKFPGPGELVGAGLVIAAILVLSLPSLLKKRQ